MIKKLINGKTSSITSAALILLIASFASKILGVIRNRILAGEFGAGKELDAYYAAFRIPDFVFNIVVLGALSAGFIPVFTKLVAEKKEEQAFKTANAILNIVFVVIIFLCILAIIFSSNLINIIAPGFNEDQKKMTTDMTRIMFLSPIFLLLSSVMGGILQSYKRFFIYSLSPIIYNIGIILGVVYFYKWWGMSGLAWGVVFGSFMHFAIQIPLVIKLGFKYKPLIDIKDAGAGKIIKMMAPRTLTLIANQLNLTIITAIASTMSAGSLTVFNLANDLQTFPLSLFAISFAVAVFPTLSALGGDENKEEFARNLTVTAKQILFFIIPISVIMIVLRAQIVRVILGTGKFSWEDTIMTLDSLEIFAISLFAQALILLFSRAFWALHDAKTPFLASIFSVLVNLVLAFILSKEYGIRGLVGAFSISSIANALILYYLINKKTNFVCHNKIFNPMLKITFASVSAGVVSYYALRAILPFLDTSTGIGIMTQGLVSGIAGFYVYCFISGKIGIEEYIMFKNSIQRRLFKTRVETAEIISEE